MNKELREEVADLCHRQWSNWMKYIFTRCEEDEVEPLDDDIPWNTGNLVIPIEWVERWKRQVNTDYKNLSEEEKDSDRKEADKYIDLMTPKCHGKWVDDYYKEVDEE